MKSVNQILIVFSVLVGLTISSNALADCFTELSDVATVAHVDNISSRWVQTDSSDQRPVSISLRETADGLFVSFVKDGSVLTEGHVLVCTENNQMVLRPIGQLVPGPNAPADLRSAMTNKGTRIRFSLQNEDQMNVRISVPVFFGAAAVTMPMTFQSN